ncbi:MAG: S8 family serine peptidase [Vicinamibacterales bacterium]
MAVRIAIIDSGVHADHPHVRGVAGGIGIDPSGREHDDFTDRLGHGTAVTAAIREKAPHAEIFAIKVFDQELAATADALVAACAWAAIHDIHIVNMSLGTRNPEHEPALTRAVAQLRSKGAVIVAAGEQDGVRWLPGALAGVWSVTLDWSLPREDMRVTTDAGGRLAFRASGFPRPIPGVPVENNLKGLSFAVANATGLLAAIWGHR